MVAQGRPKHVAGGPGPVRAFVGRDIAGVVLTDILIDRGRFSGGIVVVTDRNDKIRVPALDEVGDGLFIRARQSVIADDGEVHSPGGRQPVFQCLQRESRNGASLSPASPVRLPGSRRSGRSLELGNHLDVPLEKSSRGHRRFDSLNPGADSVFHLPFFARGRCSGSQPATAPGVLRLHQLNRHLHCDGTQAGLNFQAARMGRCQGVGEIRL